MFILCFPGFSISPEEAFSLTGDTVRLNCTYESNHPVNWKLRPLGVAILHHIYDQLVGMAKDYRLGGRHKIEQSSGRCDLVITNISLDDAGSYECCEDIGERDDVELVVLGEFFILNISITSYTCMYILAVPWEVVSSPQRGSE